MRKALFHQLGGGETVHIAVDLFYKKVMADDKLSPFFEGMNIERIKAHQRDFFTAMLGGKVDYKGRELREAHKHLVHEKGLSDLHFDRTAAHLRDTFLELGVDEKTTDYLVGIIDSLRDEVLDK